MTHCKTRVKICGLTREQDVDAAVAAGADAIGFVFYPPSPRYVAPARAAELARRIPPFVDVVGLFVNEAPETVRAVCDVVPINVLQFHGDESPAACARWPSSCIPRVICCSSASTVVKFWSVGENPKGAGWGLANSCPMSKKIPF